MSHEITETDALFSVRERPWHGLGTVLADYPTRAEAQPLVHGWEPISEPLFRPVPQIVNGEPVTVYEEAPGFRAQVRSDNNALLGVTASTYTTITNNELWDVAEAVQGSGVDVKFETGGSIKGGSHVWLMLALDEPLTIKGDPHGETFQYYMLQNNHDASGSFRGSATSVRAVCWNTIQHGDQVSKNAGTEFTFRHTPNVNDRVEEARLALRGWRESVTEWQAFNEHLIQQKVSREGESYFIEKFMPEPVGQVISRTVRKNIAEARADFLACYNGVTGEGIEGTAYGLVAAASEYGQHFRKAKNEETAFRRSFLDSNRLVSLASRFALEAATV